MKGVFWGILMVTNWKQKYKVAEKKSVQKAHESYEPAAQKIRVENNLFESELIEKRIKDTISTTIHQPVKYVIPVKKLSRNRIGKKQRKEMKERYEKGEFEDYIKKIEARNF